MPVTLKLATSLDGRIATSGGESRWITGEAARKVSHQLRAEHDAVLVGVQTALADDPELTVRLPGYAGAQPARVVLDSRQRISRDSRLVTTAHQVPTYLVTLTPPDRRLVEAGVRILRLSPSGSGWSDPKDVISALDSAGLSRIFLEGGGQVAASFLRSGLVDRIEWFRAPIVLGADSRPGVGDLAIAALAAAPQFRRTAVHEIGADLWERYERA